MLHSKIQFNIFIIKIGKIRWHHTSFLSTCFLTHITLYTEINFENYGITLDSRQSCLKFEISVKRAKKKLVAEKCKY